MINRIRYLVGYLIYRVFTSWAAVWIISATGIFYWLGFRTRTPEADYFVLVIGLFGAVGTFFNVMMMSSRANEAQSYPLFVRLESRVEYLTAVLLAGFLLTLALQLLLAVMVLIRNAPELLLGDLLQIPPIWLSVNLLLGVLALHATDFVAHGWSRIWLFGLLAILIFLGESYNSAANWLSERLLTMSYQPTQTQAAQEFAVNLRRTADWLSTTQESWLQQIARSIFWPFEAIVNGSLRRFFLPGEALAPAVLVLLATILFLIAADVFSGKDLMLVEE